MVFAVTSRTDGGKAILRRCDRIAIRDPIGQRRRADPRMITRPPLYIRRIEQGLTEKAKAILLHRAGHEIIDSNIEVSRKADHEFERTLDRGADIPVVEE